MSLLSKLSDLACGTPLRRFFQALVEAVEGAQTAGTSVAGDLDSLTTTVGGLGEDVLALQELPKPQSLQKLLLLPQ